MGLAVIDIPLQDQARPIPGTIYRNYYRFNLRNLKVFSCSYGNQLDHWIERYSTFCIEKVVKTGTPYPFKYWNRLLPLTVDKYSPLCCFPLLLLLGLFFFPSELWLCVIWPSSHVSDFKVCMWYSRVSSGCIMLWWDDFKECLQDGVIVWFFFLLRIIWIYKSLNSLESWELFNRDSWFLCVVQKKNRLKLCDPLCWVDFG